MDYLSALAYNARREDPTKLRAHIRGLEALIEAEQRPGRRRKLIGRLDRVRRRLRSAETMATYDWGAGEIEFAAWVSKAMSRPDAVARWRMHGIPLRVLIQAGYRPATWVKP
jgi:hypothetical protein